jgi:hypothetical protein
MGHSKKYQIDIFGYFAAALTFYCVSQDADERVIWTSGYGGIEE